MAGILTRGFVNTGGTVSRQIDCLNTPDGLYHLYLSILIII